MVNILRDVDPDKYFYLKEGKAIRSLPELLEVLRQCDADTFAHHVNPHRNDFGNWIRDVIADPVLAEEVFRTQEKHRIIHLLEKKIRDATRRDAKGEPPEVSAGRHIGAGVKEEKAHEGIKFTLLGDEVGESTAVFKKEAPVHDADDALEAPKLVQEFESNIDEILQKEREIAKREEKIEEIEARIEQELGLKKKEHLFSREFMQGIVVGLLLCLIFFIVYYKFFSI